MKKYYWIYALAIVTSFVLGVILQLQFQLMKFSSAAGSTIRNHAYQDFLSSTTLVVLTLLGCVVHWFFIVNKRPVAKASAMSRWLKTILISSAIAFIVGCVGFYALVIQNSQQTPFVGLFIIFLPMIGLLAAIIGAVVGLAIVAIRTVTKAK